MPDLLSVRNLKIEATSYPPGEAPKRVTIVDGVSFDLLKGRVLGLIGESGAGKSTIGLSALAYGRGGAEITGGEVLLDGDNILALGRNGIRQIRGARVCYVAQSAAAAFNPAHRLGDQVIEASVKHGLMSKQEAKKRALYLFQVLGLPHPESFGERFPHQVSGGQLQRAMTAMALCSNPELIVFDEPTTALDVTTQIDVLAAIKHAIEATHTAALYITHDLAVVAQISDDIMVLRHGKTVEYGSVQQIIEAPREDYTRALVNVRQTLRDEAVDQSDALLKIENVSAEYSNGFKVLNDVSLHVPKGQTLAIVGESGSGKSTLARAVTGLLAPTAGTISFAGKALTPDVRHRPRDDLRRIQLIYQMADTAMNPRQTVRDIIGRALTFYYGLRGVSKTDRVKELLDQIEMGNGFLNRYPAELSGGQKQRVAIARALAAKPELILCDEPTSALDPLVAEGILKLLLRLQEEEKLSYIFITHDIAIVRAIADSVAVMHRGRVVRFGPKSKALSPPFDDYTDLLLKSVPEMEIGWLEKVLTTRRMESAGN
ncbi:peptide/nickel transport system ATP-binding protein [Rhizobium sp. BK529]|uniref:ABC transporter ATP-binding protein n=1 Tax=unclassified Rhizobium TaxID=2613769 RepID=UPI00104DEB62|nr:MULTISPECIES: ABC transporter ATP-binding protein [unclassified Rhizobium]MBB3593464.1 peptide/nickel transport system ATP-binding protein [Rhizobium sp. BK529]TCS03256.1 peptide/nickel transport system ATP-binding protein [Rhizobium sp. BK418]